MHARTSQELLESVLAGGRLTAEDLDKLFLKQPHEDEHLDYKSGLLLSRDLKKARAAVREYVSGFANSDGGVLIIGVEEPPPKGVGRFIRGCERPGGAMLDVWAQSCLADMAPHFSPQPRFQVVAHPQGEVLVVAVARAPQLVPCVEARAIKYYLRMGHSTLEAPAYLLSDLVLGRRRHPVVDLRLSRIKVADGAPIFSEDKQEIAHGIGFSFQAVVDNLSLAAADEVSVGIVAWSIVGNDPHVNAHLTSYIEVGELPEEKDEYYGALRLRWRLQHIQSFIPRHKPAELRPFSNLRTDEFGSLTFPWSRRGPAATFSAAVYVMPKGSPPTWFEMSYTYDSGELGRSESDRLVRLQLRTTGLDRPRVSWQLKR